VTPDRTTAAIQARRHATKQKLQQVRDALTWLHRTKAPLTYPAIARRAGVSRTFLYENPDAKALIAEAITKTADRRTQAQAETDTRQETSWQERALNAEAALSAAHTEISAHRHHIALLMGQIRDLETDCPPEAAQRTVTENTTLKHRIRQLTHDNQTLEERLHAARSNNRFADRRIAQLEAQLTDHAPHTRT
jgi:chromosome segregation ATPase